MSIIVAVGVDFLQNRAVLLPKRFDTAAAAYNLKMIRDIASISSVLEVSKGSKLG